MTIFDFAVLCLGLSIGLTFAAHGAQKAFGWWGGPGFAGWQAAMVKMGFRPARPFALISIGAELIGGLALAIGFLTPFAAALLVAQSVVIILAVHLSKGFWSAKGGIEFALQLGVGALALGLIGRGALSVDGAFGWQFSAPALIGLMAAGILGGVISALVPRLGKPKIGVPLPAKPAAAHGVSR